MIVFGECNVYFAFLADVLADQLLFKSGDECARTDSKRIVLTLTSCKCNTVNISVKVDYSIILVLNGSVCYIDASCIVLAFLFDSFIYLGICNRCIYLVNLYTLVLSECYFGLKGNFSRKDEGLSGLELNSLDLGC